LTTTDQVLVLVTTVSTSVVSG